MADRIPPTLYEAVKAKAKREGVSLAEQRAEQPGKGRPKGSQEKP